MADYWKTGYWAPGFWNAGYWATGVDTAFTPFARTNVPQSAHAGFMRRAVNVLSAAHGRTVSYEHPSGHVVTVKAISVGNARDTLIRDDKGERSARVRTVTLRRDSTHIAGGVTEVVLDGKFTIDGEVWSVLNRPHESETSVQVLVGRDEVLEASRNDYRRT